jgi:hypothetical protein
MLKSGQRLLSSELNNQPAPADAPTDFLRHLQGRLGLDEPTTAERLQSWLLSYEPGPAALQRASGKRECDETVAA